MNRRPRTYLGINHETIGSDILAVTKALQLPERILGPELAGRLAQVKADQWYPITLLIEALEKLEGKSDAFALRNVGYRIFSLSHAEHVKKVASSASDILKNFDALYKHANRGKGIGGWNLVRFEPGRATMEKTTPHQCVVEEGIIEEALRTVGVRAEVTQSQCFRKGADLCVFEVSSAVTDQRWTG